MFHLFLSDSDRILKLLTIMAVVMVAPEARGLIGLNNQEIDAEVE